MFSSPIVSKLKIGGKKREGAATVKPLIRSTVISVCSDGLHDTFVGVCRRQSHYHNKVSLAPFFHQAPVPHVLISHGDPCDHTLVKLRVRGEMGFVLQVQLHKKEN